MTAHNFIDLTGQSFGLLKVIAQAPRLKPKIARWQCSCECGKTTVVDGRHLRWGKIRSCGCAKTAWMSERFGTHKMTDSDEYKIWCGMKRRCYNTHERCYPRYGGRGIFVSESWLNSFETFYADMGPRPSKAHSIDRINNDGPYSKENCRWSSIEEQTGNRRSNLKIEFGGEVMFLAAWSRRTGIKAETIKHRLDKGWSVEKALTQPPRSAKVTPRTARVAV